MRKVFVILSPGSAGGTGTLSIRISNELIKKNQEVVYICEKFTDENNIKALEGCGVKAFQSQKRGIHRLLFDLYGNSIEYIFLSYTLNEYIFIEKLKNKLKVEKNMLYIVHNYELIKGINYNKLQQILIKLIYKTNIKKIALSNDTIFMDEFCINELNHFYKFEFNPAVMKVINLPIMVGDIAISEVKKKIFDEEFKILTITRAEIPFKGYIIGLIDDFEKLCEKHSNLKLQIISFGRDQNKIVEKYNSLPIKIREKVELLGQIPYEDLATYFHNSKLYIGMGTTVLDAAKHGVPSIVVKSYTLKSISSGFFHDSPNMLAAYSDNLKTSAELINGVIYMNEKEYMNLCIKEHSALKNNYDINTFIEELMGPKIKSESKDLDSIFIYAHSLLGNLKVFLEIYLNIFKKGGYKIA